MQKYVLYNITVYRSNRYLILKQKPKRVICCYMDIKRALGLDHKAVVYPNTDQSEINKC